MSAGTAFEIQWSVPHNDEYLTGLLFAGLKNKIGATFREGKGSDRPEAFRGTSIIIRFGYKNGI